MAYGRRLDEYVTFNGQREAGEDPIAPQNGQNPPQNGGAQPGDGGTPPQIPAAGDGMAPPTGGPADPGMGAPQQNTGMDMGMDAPPQQNGMPADQGTTAPMPDGGMDVTQGMGLPDADMGQDGVEDIEMPDDPNAPQDGDEVIDVDDLTQSQQAAEYKIDGVDDKLTTLGAVVKKFIEALKQNDAKIDDLKAEFEKRNPTAEERLNLRSMSSVPYMETPKEYWTNKVAENPRYNVMNDNTIAPKDEQDEFELKRGDLEGRNDKELSDTFDYPMNLKDILDW